MIETLQTERLLMRPFTATDLAPLTELHAEESFWRFPLQRGMTPPETATFLSQVIEQYASARHPAFHAVVERSTGDLAGWGGLGVPNFLPEVLPAIEVAWRLGPAFRGRGYATELGAAALRWGFTSLGLERVISTFQPENVASGRVMDRLGFGPGYRTTWPGRGLALVVRTLTIDEWRSHAV